MKKTRFEQIKRDYLKGRKRLENIAVGSLVWEEVGHGGWDMDYHPAVVKSVNVDEDYIEVLDVSDRNQEKRYTSFLTREEMVAKGFSEESIEEDYKKYAEVIKTLKK